MAWSILIKNCSFLDWTPLHLFSKSADEWYNCWQAVTLMYLKNLLRNIWVYIEIFDFWLQTCKYWPDLSTVWDINTLFSFYLLYIWSHRKIESLTRFIFLLSFLLKLSLEVQVMDFSSLTEKNILKALVCHQIVNTRSQEQGKLHRADKIATAKCKHYDATIFFIVESNKIQSGLLSRVKTAVKSEDWPYN